MVMDEVLAVGDMKFQQKCLGKMGDAANSEGRTVLYVSHNMNTIRQLCTRCIVLDHGKLIFDGDVERAIEIYEELSRNSKIMENYTDYVRPKWLRGDELRIQTARYLKKDMNIFKCGEKIPIEFEILYTKQVELLGLRYVQTLSIEFDIGGLVAGDYKCFFTFYTHNGISASKDVDCVPGLQFSVMKNTKDTNLEWRPLNWGYIKLPEPRIIMIKTNHE